MAADTRVIVEGTPLERYPIARTPLSDGGEVWVKREDLCTPPPGPNFSKLRGVAAHIAKRPEPVIGVLDTYHSNGGWGVSYICRALGKRCVVYWPRFKADPAHGLARLQQQKAHALGAATVALPAGRSAILYHAARKHLREHSVDGESYFMPNALKLPESVTETAAEVARTELPDGMDRGTVVVSVSSGTMAAGVLRGLAQRGCEPHVVLHLGYSRSKEAVQKYVEEAGGVPFFRFASVSIIDEGYSYRDEAKPERWQAPPPFPCNPHYDLKAWWWLERFGYRQLPGPVLFWNIGG